jgi:protein gp37
MKQPAVREKYSGRPRLHARSMDQKLGHSKVIFVSDCTDLFAGAVPVDFRKTLLNRYCDSPENWYHFRTKNPYSYRGYCKAGLFPPKTILGISLETTYATYMEHTGISYAPIPYQRVSVFADLHAPGVLKMVALEPLFSFEIHRMVEWMQLINPAFVTVGIDSKKTPHPIGEPTAEGIEAIVMKLVNVGDVILKDNLLRILGHQRWLELSDWVYHHNSQLFRDCSDYQVPQVLHGENPDNKVTLVNIDGFEYLDGLQAAANQDEAVKRSSFTCQSYNVLL